MSQPAVPPNGQTPASSTKMPVSRDVSTQSVPFIDRVGVDGIPRAGRYAKINPRLTAQGNADAPNANKPTATALRMLKDAQKGVRTDPNAPGKGMKMANRSDDIGADAMPQVGQGYAWPQQIKNRDIMLAPEGVKTQVSHMRQASKAADEKIRTMPNFDVMGGRGGESVRAPDLSLPSYAEQSALQDPTTFDAPAMPEGATSTSAPSPMLSMPTSMAPTAIQQQQSVGTGSPMLDALQFIRGKLGL